MIDTVVIVGCILAVAAMIVLRHRDHVARSPMHTEPPTAIGEHHGDHFDNDPRNASCELCGQLAKARTKMLNGHRISVCTSCEEILSHPVKPRQLSAMLDILGDLWKLHGCSRAELIRRAPEVVAEQLRASKEGGVAKWRTQVAGQPVDVFFYVVNDELMNVFLAPLSLLPSLEVISQRFGKPVETDGLGDWDNHNSGEIAPELTIRWKAKEYDVVVNMNIYGMATLAYRRPRSSL